MEGGMEEVDTEEEAMEVFITLQIDSSGDKSNKQSNFKI